VSLPCPVRRTQVYFGAQVSYSIPAPFTSVFRCTSVLQYPPHIPQVYFGAQVSYSMVRLLSLCACCTFFCCQFGDPAWINVAAVVPPPLKLKGGAL